MPEPSCETEPRRRAATPTIEASRKTAGRRGIALQPSLVTRHSSLLTRHSGLTPPSPLDVAVQCTRQPQAFRASAMNLDGGPRMPTTGPVGLHRRGGGGRQLREAAAASQVIARPPQGTEFAGVQVRRTAAAHRQGQLTGRRDRRRTGGGSRFRCGDLNRKDELLAVPAPDEDLVRARVQRAVAGGGRQLEIDLF